MPSRKSVCSVLLIELILLVVFYIISSSENTLVRLADAFFMSGLLCVLIGVCCTIRNGGILKGFSYLGYRRQKKNIAKKIEAGMLPKNEKTLDFAEYVSKKYEKKWASKVFYIFGLPLIIVSAICSLLNGW